MEAGAGDQCNKKQVWICDVRHAEGGANRIALPHGKPVDLFMDGTQQLV
jgi:hypothetical protein